MAILKIPIRNDLPAYIEQVDLEGRLYFFTFRFNARMDRWIWDIADADQNPIIVGIPVLINQDLLGRFVSNDLPPGKFAAINLSTTQVQPNRTLFSTDVELHYEESTT